MPGRKPLIATAILTIAAPVLAQDFHPVIPKAWDDKEIAQFEMQLEQADRSPSYMAAEEYYALKVRPIYRSYAVYAPGRVPAGYIESLKQKEPEIIFDASKLRTMKEWIQAGKLVFESDVLFRPAPATAPSVQPALPPSRDGILPFFLSGYRYYVRKKGMLEIGSNACANCHTRVMPDGSLLEGAQGVVDQAPTPAALTAARERLPEDYGRRVENNWVLFGAPWIMSKEAFQASYTKDRLIREFAALHPGVLARQGTSRSHPPHIPSLIGIQDLKYLDATGLVQHRSIADLMRYAIINQGLDTIAYFGDFQPSAKPTSFSSE